MKRILAGAAVVLIVLGAAGAWLAYRLPDLVADRIRSHSPGTSFAAVSIGWDGITASDVRHPSRSGRSLYHAETVAIRPLWRSLLGDQVEIEAIEVEGLVVERIAAADTPAGTASAAGNDGPAGAGDGARAAAGRGDDGRAPAAVTVAELTVRGGPAELAIRPQSGPSMTVTLDDLELAAGPFRYPQASAPIPLVLSASLGDGNGGTIRASGSWQPEDRRGYLEVGLDGIDLRSFESVYRSPETTVSLDSGSADIKVVIEAGDGRYSALGSVRLDDLGFTGDGRFLGIPTELLDTYLERNQARIEFPFKLEGDIGRRGGYRPVIIEALLRNVVAILREDRRAQIQELLDRGDVEGARREVERLGAQALAL